MLSGKNNEEIQELKNILEIKDDNELLTAFSSALKQKKFTTPPTNLSFGPKYKYQDYRNLLYFVYRLIQQRMFSHNSFNFSLMNELLKIADSNPSLKEVIIETLKDTTFSPAPLMSLLAPNKELFEKGLAYLKEVPDIHIERILSSADGNRPSALSSLAQTNDIGRIDSLLSDYKFNKAQTSNFFFYANHSSMELKTMQFLAEKDIKVSKEFRMTPNRRDSIIFEMRKTDDFAFGKSSIQKLIWLHEDEDAIFHDPDNYQKRNKYLELLTLQSKLGERKEIIKTKKKLLGGHIQVDNNPYGGGKDEKLTATELEVKRSDIAYLKGLLIEAQCSYKNKNPADGHTLKKAEQYYIEAVSASGNNQKAILKLVDLYFKRDSIEDAMIWFKQFVENLESDSEKDNHLALLLHDKKIINNLINFAYKHYKHIDSDKVKKNKEESAASYNLLNLLLELRQHNQKLFDEKLDIYSCGKLAELLNIQGQPLAAKYYLKQYYLLNKTPSPLTVSDSITDNIYEYFYARLMTEQVTYENIFSNHSHDMELFLITLSKHVSSEDEVQKSINTEFSTQLVKNFISKVISHGLQNTNNPEFEKNIQRFFNFIIEHKDTRLMEGIIDNMTIQKIQDRLKLSLNQTLQTLSEDSDLTSLNLILNPTVQKVKEDKFSSQNLEELNVAIKKIPTVDRDSSTITTKETKILDMLDSLKNLLKTMLLIFEKTPSTALDKKHSIETSPSALSQYSLHSRPATPEPLGIEEEPLGIQDKYSRLDSKDLRSPSPLLNHSVLSRDSDGKPIEKKDEDSSQTISSLPQKETVGGDSHLPSLEELRKKRVARFSNK